MTCNNFFNDLRAARTDLKAAQTRVAELETFLDEIMVVDDLVNFLNAKVSRFLKDEKLKEACSVSAWLKNHCFIDLNLPRGSGKSLTARSLAETLATPDETGVSVWLLAYSYHKYLSDISSNEYNITHVHVGSDEASQTDVDELFWGKVYPRVVICDECPQTAKLILSMLQERGWKHTLVISLHS